MIISPLLFFGLLVMAVVPAYLTAFYAMYALKQFSNILAKEQELQLASINGLRKGADPLYTTSMDLKDFVDILQKKKGVKETDNSAVPSAGGGHYL